MRARGLFVEGHDTGRARSRLSSHLIWPVPPLARARHRRLGWSRLHPAACLASAMDADPRCSLPVTAGRGLVSFRGTRAMRPGPAPACLAAKLQAADRSSRRRVPAAGTRCQSGRVLRRPSEAPRCAHAHGAAYKSRLRGAAAYHRVSHREHPLLAMLSRPCRPSSTSPCVPTQRIRRAGLGKEAGRRAFTTAGKRLPESKAMDRNHPVAMAKSLATRTGLVRRPITRAMDATWPPRTWRRSL